MQRETKDISPQSNQQLILQEWSDFPNRKQKHNID